MTRRQIYDYFFLGLLCFALYGILKIFIPFAGPLLVSLLCAITFYPMYQALHRHFPKRSSTFHAVLADILVLIFFVAPLLLLGWAVVQESSSVMLVVKRGTTTVAQWRDGNILESTPWIAHLRFFLSRVFGMRHAQFQEKFVEQVNNALEYLSLTGTLLAKNVIALVIDLMIMLFSLFFMFRDGKRLWHEVQNLLPVRHEHQENIAARIHDAMLGIARGLFLTSLIQGVAATIGFLLVGAEGAVLLGALTAVMGLIPLVGTFGIWVPAGVFFLIKGSYVKGIFLLVWGLVVIVGLVDTLVRPYLVGNKMELPLFALVFALLGGAEVWGAKGLIIGPLLISMLPVLLEIYRQNYLRDTYPTRDEDQPISLPIQKERSAS